MVQPLNDDGRIPALHEMTARAQRIACAYYAAGYEHGVAEGRRQAHAETWGDPDDAHAGADLKALALLPARADLLERRGQHQAAEEYRAMLRDRGLTA